MHVHLYTYAYMYICVSASENRCLCSLFYVFTPCHYAGCAIPVCSADASYTQKDAFNHIALHFNGPVREVSLQLPV